jgi:hypothetical protein
MKMAPPADKVEPFDGHKILKSLSRFSWLPRRNWTSDAALACV